MKLLRKLSNRYAQRWWRKGGSLWSEAPESASCTGANICPRNGPSKARSAQWFEAEGKNLQVAKRRKDRLRLSSVSCEWEVFKIFSKELMRVGKISASLMNNCKWDWWASTRKQTYQLSRQIYWKEGPLREKIFLWCILRLCPKEIRQDGPASRTKE